MFCQSGVANPVRQGAANVSDGVANPVRQRKGANVSDGVANPVRQGAANVSDGVANPVRQRKGAANVSDGVANPVRQGLIVFVSSNQPEKYFHLTIILYTDISLFGYSKWTFVNFYMQ